MLEFFTSQDTQLFRLLLLLGIVLVFLILKNSLAKILVRALSVRLKRKDKDKAKAFNLALYKPFSWLIFIFALVVVYPLMNFAIAPELHMFLMKVLHSLLIISSLFVFYSFVAFFLRYQDAEKHKNAWNYLKTALSAITITIGIIMVLNQWIANLEALIAGLGVTGLMIALAAQDTASNLVAGLAIMLDKPFEIGDWIDTDTDNGHLAGTVEAIGLRSSRVRTMDNSYVTVPNNLLGAAMIVNGTKRSARLVNFQIPLGQSVQERSLHLFREEAIRILEEDPGVIKESIKVHFMDFERDSLIWQVRYNTGIDFTEHLDTRHRVNMKLWQLANSMGYSLAEGITVK